MAIEPLRLVLRTVLSLAVLLTVVSCGTLSREKNGGDDSDDAGGEETIAMSPNTRLGEVIWLNPAGTFAVVKMDGRFDLPETFLLALDPAARQVVAILASSGLVEGLSTGARVLEGQVSVGDEIQVPGPEMSNFLLQRYSPPAPQP